MINIDFMDLTINKFEMDILKGLRSSRDQELNAAIKKLYNPEWIGLARKAVKSAGGRDDDVEDIFQISLTALVKSVIIGRFQGDSKLSTYFYSICWRTAMKIDPKGKFTEIDEKMIQGSAPSPETLIMEKEKREEKKKLIDQVFDAMGEPNSSILKYRKRGYSYTEIAKEMGYDNSDTVKNQAARAREKLRKHLSSNPKLYKRLKDLI